MKTRNCLALALTSVLAIGCASARAQDGPGNPPPGPQPQGPPPGGPQGQGRDGPKPQPDPAEMKRRMAEKVAMIEKQIADATSGNKAADVEEVEQWKRHANMLRERIAQIDRGEMPAPMEPRGPGGQRPMDGRRVDFTFTGPQNGPPPGDRMRGPGPSVEQRLAMLERAVREMHEMFERHNVPPEARERAEREMRDRRDGGPPPRDGRPGESRPPEGPGAGPRPDAGGPPPMGPDGGERPPRPPMPPRAGGPGQPNMDEVRKQMEAAHDQVEELRKQLADTQAALKKAQAEIEELRANAKK
jgi:hypothetical protein